MTSSAPFEIRNIRIEDNGAVAGIIRRVMPEYGAGGAGFAIHDPEVDAMFETYSAPRSVYFVVVRAGQVLGGAGVAPLAGGDASTCELRKLLPRDAPADGGGAGALPQERFHRDQRTHGQHRPLRL